MTPSDATIAEILTQTKTIALVGWSPKPDRPSHRVAAYLAGRGYRVIPVNPGQSGVTSWGEPIWPDLASVPDAGSVDMVDIFRRSDQVVPIVQQALAHLPNLRTVWMQLGVMNAEAAALAGARGVTVVQNRCPAIEIPRLGL